MCLSAFLKLILTRQARVLQTVVILHSSIENTFANMASDARSLGRLF